MSFKFCSTCIHWEKIAPKPTDAFGICTDVSVAMNVNLMPKSNLSEDNVMWTTANFGCIYWREDDGSLLSTDDEVDDEIESYGSDEENES